MGQHVALDASFQWGVNGSLFATVTPSRADFIPAAAGNVFVTWGGSDLRCARLGTTGTRVWPEPDGRVLVTPPSSPVNVRAVTDGAGGQRLAWSFDNAGQDDVYTLMVDGAGAPQPGQSASGEPFATTALAEEPVTWLSPESTAPTAVWLSGGILKARLPGTSVSVGPGGLAGSVALSPPSPNPLRGSRLTLRFSAPSGPTRLELFDAAGRRVLARALYSNGGAQTLPLDEATRLAPGVYTLRLSAAGSIASQRLVRVD
jgi:hypothetical protein